MPTRKSWARLVLAALASAAVAPTASGQFFTWTNAAGGTFSVGSNWNPLGPPSVGQAAVFSLASTYAVTLTTSPNIGSMTVSAGTVTFNGGAQTLSLATVANFSGGVATLASGTLSAGTDLIINNTSRVTVQGGADVVAARLLLAQSGSNGTFNVTGTGSTARFTNAAPSLIGQNGGAGTALFSNGAIGTFSGGIGLADSNVASSAGTLNVISAAQVFSTGNIEIAPNGVAGQVGFLQVGGTLSAFTHSGPGTIIVGAAANSAGTISVGPGATFTTGTGTTTVNATGNIVVATGGTFLANGNVVVNGGSVNVVGSGVLNTVGAANLTVQNNGAAAFGNTAAVNGGSTWFVTAGTLSVNSTTTIGSATNGTLSFNGAAARGSLLGSTVVGFAGGTGRVEVLGGGSAGFASIGIADSINSSTRGSMEVGAGSTITFGSGVSVATQASGGAVGTFLVGGRADVGTGATTTVGSATATGSALLQVNTGGNFGAPDAGTIQVNATGRLFVNGGSVDAGTHVNVAGGRIDFSGSTSALDLADGNNGTLTVSGGGTMTAGSVFISDNDRYFIVDSTLSVGTSTTVGSGSFGVLNVSGAAARLTGGNLSVQAFGSTIDSEFRMSNAAVGTLGNVSLSGSTANTLLSITTGARLTAGNLSLSGATLGPATFSMSGGTSEFTQTGASSVSIGNSATSPNSHVSVSAGTWTTGTGQFLLQPSGRMSVLGTGVVRPLGSVRSDDGAMSVSDNAVVDIAGDMEVVNNGTLTIAEHAQMFVGGTASFDGSTTLTINGPAAALRIAGALSASIFARLDVQNGLLEFGGADYGGATTSNGKFFATLAPTDMATVQVNGGSFNGFGNGSFYSLHNGGIGTAGLNRLNFVNGASMTLSGTLSIGRENAAELNVLSGSDVAVGLLSGPFDATGSAAILVDGAGSTVTTTDLRLGLAGSPATVASARVRNGGLMTVNGQAVFLGGSEVHVEPGGTLFMGNAATIGSPFSTSTGRLGLDGGTLSLPSPVLLLAHAGPFEFAGGTIALRSASALDPALQARLLGPARTLGPGQALSVTGAASFTGGGAQPLTLAGGVLAVGTLANTTGGVVVRSGTLSISGGPLLVGATSALGGDARVGPDATISVANSGSIAAGARLVLDRSTLTVTAMNSAGELRLIDDARLSSGTFANTGTIAGFGRITAGLTNNAGGRVRAVPGDQITVNSLTNNGSIDLLGGRVHVLTTLTNGATGAIAGSGNLEVGGAFANSGTVTFTGGTTDLQAPLTNNATGRFTVTGGSHTTVYGAVNNVAGSTFRVAENSIAAFLGNVTGLAAFTGPGTKIFEAGASGGPLVSELGRTIVESAGDLDAARIREARLEVYGDAAVVPSASSLSPSVSRVQSLFIAGGPGAYTGRLDIANNAFVIDYSGASVLPEVNDEVLVGFAGGAWTGNGIRSGSAAATPGTAVGIAEASDLGLAAFLGEPIDSTAVLLRFTRLGDANLDGTTGIGDFALLAANFNQPSRWSRGDFNYSGTTNIGDFALLAANFNQTVPAETRRGNLIPEPAAGGVAAVAAAAALASCRRLKCRGQP